MTPSLVIFDCDGVLVDTETSVNHVLLSHLHRVGYKIPLEQSRRQFVGRPIVAIQKMVEAELGRQLGAEWAQDIHKDTIALLEKGVSAITGIEPVLNALQNRQIPFCVASSGLLSKMRLSLGGAGLLPYFEGKMFSAEHVREGKPAPDLFLLAAQTMGFEPEKCLVIEDSVPGVQAALAAHMGIIAYAGDPHSDHEGIKALGVLSVERMDDLSVILGF